MATQEQAQEVVDLRIEERVAKAHLGDACAMRGYVYTCRQVADSAEVESEDGEEIGIGYHGGDMPPCAAEYLCDQEDGYLVISTEESADDIETVEGWEIVPAKLDAGDFFNDGTWSLAVIRCHGGHKYTCAGST